MIACISPNEADIHESISTLQYAAKTRVIQNKVVANITTIKANDAEIHSLDIISHLQNQVKALQTELLQTNNHNAFGNSLRRYIGLFPFDLY